MFSKVYLSHSMGTGSARTVSLEVYLNYDDEGGAPASGSSTAMQCAPAAPCPEATGCGGISAEVKASRFFEMKNQETKGGGTFAGWLVAESCTGGFEPF